MNFGQRKEKQRKIRDAFNFVVLRKMQIIANGKVDISNVCSVGRYKIIDTRECA
jgi:hypothetical protein